jgi:phosphoribosylpyrophosphate synthetase
LAVLARWQGTRASALWSTSGLTPVTRLVARAQGCNGSSPGRYEHLRIVGEPGRRALVVDDILDTGGTLALCCRHLRNAGVEEIGVVATHALFAGVRWRVLLHEGVQRLWITDTVMSRRRPPDVEVVPIAPLLAPVLTGTGD